MQTNENQLSIIRSISYLIDANLNLEKRLEFNFENESMVLTKSVGCPLYSGISAC